MQQLNDEQLNARIESFITRKHQEYPELGLLKSEKRAESIGYVIADKITEMIATVKYTKLVH